MRVLLLAGLTLLAVGCLAPATLADAALSRQGVEGPYLAGTPERFVLQVPEGTRVTWSASGGALAGQNESLEWTMPEGVATLTAELARGEERVTREWHFQVEPAPRPGVTSAREALLAAPIAVIDGGVETSGKACDLATDSTGNVHLAFTTSTHPSIFYGRWNGSAWTIEFVDGLGFNVGGLVDDTKVKLAVEGNGTPHLLYSRSSQLWWATKSGATWTRERVDTDALRSQGNRFALTLNPNASNRPTVVYASYNASFYDRITIAQRTAANTWTPTQYLGTSSTWEQPRGDALYLGANLVFPFASSSAPNRGLMSFNGTALSFFGISAFDLGHANAVGVSSNRLLVRTTEGVVDVTVGLPFSASTATYSASTIGGGAEGDLAWNGTRPVVLQYLNGNLELATPAADGYWTWTALGQTSNSTAALVLHPTSGVANICYQANGRIMFQ
jgi:hypothetical protein